MTARIGFERALETARPQQARSFELRAATSLARFWRDQAAKPSANSHRWDPQRSRYEARLGVGPVASPRGDDRRLRAKETFRVDAKQTSLITASTEVADLERGRPH